MACYAKFENMIPIIDDFKKYEPYLVSNILPIVLKRIDDKPNVAEIALKVGQYFISKVSIQAFPKVIQLLFYEMRM